MKKGLELLYNLVDNALNTFEYWPYRPRMVLQSNMTRNRVAYRFYSISMDAKKKFA